MMKFNAIRVHSAPEALAQQIVEMIVSGSLAPGDCLPSQRELARAFQVGLGSVREAIRILNVMGYLQVIPGKGTFVSGDGAAKNAGNSSFGEIMEAVSLAELMEARVVVECGAAALAAEQAEDEDLARLKEITARMGGNYKNKDDYYRDDFEFHLSVAEASGNSALLEIVKLLFDKSSRHLDFMTESLGLSMPVNSKKCSSTAQEVVSWIELKNSEKAAEAMRVHLDVVNNELKKGFFQSRRKPAKADRRRLRA